MIDVQIRQTHTYMIYMTWHDTYGMAFRAPRKAREGWMQWMDGWMDGWMDT